MPGWIVVHYPVHGDGSSRKNIGTLSGKSYAFCKMVVENWRNSWMEDGSTELAIEPEEGWESYEGDAIAAIVHQVAEGTMSRDVAINQLHRIARRRDADD